MAWPRGTHRLAIEPVAEPIVVPPPGEIAEESPGA
jgi:hypothetical protein